MELDYYRPREETRRDWNFLRPLWSGAGRCQMNMTDATLIAMRREIRVDKVYLSTSKQFEIKRSIGYRHQMRFHDKILNIYLKYILSSLAISAANCNS